MEICVPNHIAIIPDGNRRWAINQKKKVFLGHKEGAVILEKILRASFDAGVHCFTVWGASEDNLTKRSRDEVRVLSKIFISTLTKLLKSKELKQYDVRIFIRGRFRELLNNEALNDIAEKIEKETEHRSGKILTVLLGYDGRKEMLSAISKIQKQKREITEQLLLDQLWTGHLPPIDFVIRTGGEPHWSAGFMMWHTANSEFYFTKTLWPAFSEKELSSAFREFARRRRMMGA